MIEARELKKDYGDVHALDGLGFAVAAGTVFGLLGPNGAGKSTTVKVLTTLARPDAGTATVAGHDVLREPAQVRRSIGVVAQRSGVDRDLTGRENVKLQGHLQGMRGRELDRRTDELLEQLGLAEAARRVARTYSGGMQRRLDIAMGLVHRPKVLFLDEPTTGLDPEVRAAMWQEIGRLKDEEGLTILLTTHYMDEADQLASQLAIVDRGRVVVEGSPAELKASLHGDAVHVELEGASVNGNVQAALEGVPGLREVLVEGRALHARVDDGARAVPAVLAALDAHSVPVATVTVARPSLDDVYLRYAGRSFSASTCAGVVPCLTPGLVAGSGESTQGEHRGEIHQGAGDRRGRDSAPHHRVLCLQARPARAHTLHAPPRWRRHLRRRRRALEDAEQVGGRPPAHDPPLAARLEAAHPSPTGGRSEPL